MGRRPGAFTTQRQLETRFKAFGRAHRRVRRLGPAFEVEIDSKALLVIPTGHVGGRDEEIVLPRPLTLAERRRARRCLADDDWADLYRMVEGIYSRRATRMETWVAARRTSSETR
jgi:hypothetical protein